MIPVHSQESTPTLHTQVILPGTEASIPKGKQYILHQAKGRKRGIKPHQPSAQLSHIKLLLCRWFKLSAAVLDLPPSTEQLLCMFCGVKRKWKTYLHMREEVHQAKHPVCTYRGAPLTELLWLTQWRQNSQTTIPAALTAGTSMEQFLIIIHFFIQNPTRHHLWISSLPKSVDAQKYHCACLIITLLCKCPSGTWQSDVEHPHGYMYIVKHTFPCT